MSHSEPTPNNLLYLIDGTAFAYRAHYARLTLTNSKGDPTDAVYGFANTMLRIIRTQNPDYIAVVFDAKGKTFRDEVYPQYKANRKPMPDELRLQFPLIVELVEALGIKSFSIEGVEADDVICLETPEPLIAVGRWYRRFGQLSHAEVVEALSLGQGRS